MAEWHMNLGNNVDHDIDGDSTYTIDDLISKLKKVKKEYGSNVTVWFDAGYNNVDVKIHREK